MKVTVHYLAQVKSAAGVGSETVELRQGGSFQDLLGQLTARHGDGFRRILLDGSGSLQNSILLFIGDEQVRWEPARPLRDGDVVTVLAPMAGG